MDQYGSTDGGTHEPDPVPDTGLEEPMWKLGLGEKHNDDDDNTDYPERAGEPDCIYYMRTGSCGYGDRCRFNHPRHRPPVTGGGRAVEGGEYPERAGQPVCQYYLRTGTCKFGSSCKYHHPKQGAGSASLFSLNIYGYPLRPGEKECSYYMKTGQCKFGMTCKFNHPQPANVQVPAATPAAVPPAPNVASSPVYPPSVHSALASPSPQQYGLMTGNWSIAARPPVVPGSYIQGPYGTLMLSPGVVPFPGWAPYPVPSPVTTATSQSAVGAGHIYGLTQLSPSAPAYTGAYPSIPSSAGLSSSISKEHSFPQRPGQPDCQYYLKTGDCKFGSSCKYHHPAEWFVPETSSALSPMGLPLRPGTPTCSYYAQHGVCKFGPTCKFDHPMGTLSYSPSASSLVDMPVAPYPAGSLMGTLAPSSSSSDLRAEVTSGSNKDSGASISSKSGSISKSSAQSSNQSPPAPCSTTDKH